jgi:hypothetical protein
MKRRLKAPSPALVISLIALFVALGGTTYAATSLRKNSVGTAQLKNGAVTKKKINKKTIAALKGNQGPPAGANAIVRSAQFVVGAHSQNGGVVLCQAGERATGGGLTPGGITAGQIIPLENAPANSAGQVAGPGQAPQGWFVVLSNALGSPITGTVYAVCVPA